MKLKYLALVASSALFFSACTAAAPATPSPSPAAMTPLESPKVAASTAPKKVASKLVSLTQQNKSGQSGTMEISMGPNGNAVVTLTLSGGKFSAPQPAHIHLGSCPTPGAVKYPLKDVLNGKSVTTLDASFEDLTQGSEKLAVNVHQSAKDAKVYTSCGDLN